MMLLVCPMTSLKGKQYSKRSDRVCDPDNKSFALASLTLVNCNLDFLYRVMRGFSLRASGCLVLHAHLVLEDCHLHVLHQASLSLHENVSSLLPHSH